MSGDLKLRPLEREDLKFVHRLNNDAKIMSYWFEEPYEAFVELQELYDKHIHGPVRTPFYFRVRWTNGWISRVNGN